MTPSPECLAPPPSAPSPLLPGSRGLHFCRMVLVPPDRSSLARLDILKDPPPTLRVPGWMEWWETLTRRAGDAHETSHAQR